MSLKALINPLRHILYSIIMNKQKRRRAKHSKVNKEKARKRAREYENDRDRVVKTMILAGKWSINSFNVC